MFAPLLWLVVLLAALTVSAADPEATDLRAQQKQLRAFAAKPSAEADRSLAEMFVRYESGALPVAWWLEFFEAAAASKDAAIRQRATDAQRALEESRDVVKRYRACLEGGDAANGRTIFEKKAEAGCIRCHRAGGDGGQIGPNLTSLRQHTDRVFIIESIVDPNTVITPGFLHVLLKLKSGESVTGILSFESGAVVTITSVVDGKRRDVPTEEIAERTVLPSAMPAGFGTVLSKRELRDLVEFLATLEE